MIRDLLVSSLLTLGSLLVRAEEPLVIIVHPESGVTCLTLEEATNLFMGRQKCLAPGLLALPVDQMQPEIRARFYRLLVNKAVPEVSAYWARLCFSGQARPPRQARTSEEVIALVAANKSAIGFVEQDKLDPRVRGILILGSPRTP